MTNGVPIRSVTLAFGDAELTATNRENAFVVEDLAGWWGGVGVKGTRTARLGHGDFPAPNRRTGRAMTLNLIWVGESIERDYVNRTLSGLFSDGEIGTLTATVGDLTLTAESVTLDGEVGVSEVGTLGTRAQVPLHAADPHLYGGARETYLRPIGAGVGFEFAPFNRDMGDGNIITFGSRIDTTEYIWNDGNALSWPVFTVTADSPGGFAVAIGGRRVTYPHQTFPDMPVTVDMSGALTVGGADQSHLIGERAWSGVAPSTLEIPAFEFLRGGTGYCVVTHRDVYL